MGYELLPRTISVVRAGGDYTELNQEAAVLTAAFVRDAQLPMGTPLAVILDQSALPYDEEYICTSNYRRVLAAIRDLEVRGAPAIGIAGAIAMLLCSSELAHSDYWCDGSSYFMEMDAAAETTISVRPTAVNLKWAVHRVMETLSASVEVVPGATFDRARATDVIYAEVERMIAADEAANRNIGEYGAALLPENATVLTHCNAGSLATSFYGTALGVIYSANEKGGITRVYADETRPVGQGARLTVWELAKAGIPTTLICDNMAASVMAQGLIDAVVVGADRVAANGDTANKIGTLGVAILAKAFGVPFYIACPVSTIDAATPTGKDIPIEERNASEVLPRPIEGVDVFNPAFDVTPASYITAIITNTGVFAPQDILKALES